MVRHILPSTFGPLTVQATYDHHAGLFSTDPMTASYNVMDRWYNLATLNLGYHTAHHYRPIVHWSRLPELHAKIAPQIPKELYRPPGAPFSWIYAARRFLADTTKNRVLGDGARVGLSSIFKWFREDFEKTGTLAQFVARYAPPPLAAALARTKAADARDGAEVRHLLREEFGDDPFLPICADIESLDDCAMLVSASNSILPILNARNVGKAVRIICDVSVPSDVDPALIEARPDIDVIRGGIALAPAAKDFEIDFLDLPANCMLACMAETAVIGLAGQREFVSIGDIDAESVRRCEALATSLGFSLGHASAKKPFAVEL